MEFPRCVVAHEIPDGLFNADSPTRFGRCLSHGIGVDFHEARFSLGRFPAAGLSGFANELAGGESAVNPLGTAASAAVRIRLPTGRGMAGAVGATTRSRPPGSARRSRGQCELFLLLRSTRPRPLYVHHRRT